MNVTSVGFQSKHQPTYTWQGSYVSCTYDIIGNLNSTYIIYSFIHIHLEINFIDY